MAAEPRLYPRSVFIKVGFSLAFLRHFSLVILAVRGILNILRGNQISVVSNAFVVAFVNDIDSLPYCNTRDARVFVTWTAGILVSLLPGYLGHKSICYLDSRDCRIFVT